MLRLPVLAVAVLLLCAPAASAQKTYTQVDTSGRSVCAIETGGALSCTGTKIDGQPTGTFKQVSIDAQHGCAIRTDDTLACWGYNVSGESTSQPGTWKTVSVGGLHTCGMDSTGELVCWGDQSRGARNPVQGQYTEVSAGGSHTCGLKTDRTVACWGLPYPNSTRGPGFPKIPDCTKPICVTPWTLPAGEYIQVSAGAEYQCAIRTDGTLACAGFAPDTPKNMPPAGTFTQVDAGSDHACALRTDKTIACWGKNALGTLEPPPGPFEQISVGGDACALRADGTYVCWETTPDRLKPTLSGLLAKPSTFRAAPRGGSAGGSTRYGTRLTFRVSEPGSVTLTLRTRAGKRVPGSYTASTNGPKGSLPRTDSFRFTGRFFTSFAPRAVKPGAYTLVLAPRDAAGNAGASRSIPIRIKR
ncbi:MAG: hypothetical protein JWP18_7 [Solirubrobacterales bacterium]|nr:hypothetical protein [Solirubrobacterales bacterium]